MPLHIVHVLHSSPPATYGGIESYVEALTGEQLRNGHRVSILTGSHPRLLEGGDRAANAFPGAALECVIATSAADALGRSPARGRAFSSTLERLRPDVVHVHHWINLGLNLVRRVRTLGIPVVLTLHDHYSSCFRVHRLDLDLKNCEPEIPLATCVHCGIRNSGWPEAKVRHEVQGRNRSLRAEVFAANAVLALSRTQWEEFARLPAFHGARIQVIPLPPQTLEPVVRSYQKAGGARFLTWGGLVPGKGLHVLVAAVEQLALELPVRVDHFGRIIDVAYAAELAAASKRSELHLHGRYQTEDLREFAARADACVFPSLFRETHGFVVDEALSLGPPVVVSDHGAPPDRIGGRGVVFPRGDVDALIATLRRVLQPAEQIRLRQGMPALTPPMESHATSLEQIYRTAMDSPNPRRSS